jgi:hypothetical protein
MLPMTGFVLVGFMGDDIAEDGIAIDPGVINPFTPPIGLPAVGVQFAFVAVDVFVSVRQLLIFPPVSQVVRVQVLVSTHEFVGSVTHPPQLQAVAAIALLPPPNNTNRAAVKIDL